MGIATKLRLGIIAAEKDSREGYNVELGVRNSE